MFDLFKNCQLPLAQETYDKTYMHTKAIIKMKEMVTD